MAATTKTWADNSAPTLNDDDLNGFKNENNNLIVGSGLALSTSDNQQTHKAVAIYAGAGDYYTETGAADAYVCTVVGSRQAPPSYLDGMRIRFLAGNTNTGASTVNVDGIGVVNLVDDQTGLALAPGAISTVSISEAHYDGSDFRFVAPLTVDNLLAGTITHEMTVDADYTLLATENRFGRVVITDTVVTLTGAVNIIVADTERVFFAQNATAEILTFKTASGTGVAIAVGTSQELYCDGTNVIVPADTFKGTADNVVTNANLTGDVTSVGNVTTLAASGIGNAALKTTTVSLAGSLAAGAKADLTMNAYAFFPMIHAEDNGGAGIVVGGHITDGASADNPRFQLWNQAGVSNGYDVDYRYIQA